MKRVHHVIFCCLFIISSALPAAAQVAKVKPIQKGKIWTVEKANDWYSKHQWIVGANFIPSNAINQLEMWQQDSFDPATIDRELGYAEKIGFNTVRVFLHSIVYGEGPKSFKSRIDQYLAIANKHHIQTIFVFFDDCWNWNPKPGKQPGPKAGIHNSGWMQDPGVRLKEPKEFNALEGYVKDIMGSFAHDKRILLWDLYNEPGNSTKRDTSLVLLTKVFSWARDVNPDQPISAGIWAWDFEKLNAFQSLNSDIITYHDYEPDTAHTRVVQLLKTHGRPMICTEYMARSRRSTFKTILPVLKKENVGAISWGLVSGKTNTKYAWDTPLPDGTEPKLWFHDIFHQNGTPYIPEETEFIRKITEQPKTETLK
jgi:hypothetical protein